MGFDPRIVQPFANRYTDYANQAPRKNLDIYKIFNTWHAVRLYSKYCHLKKKFTLHNKEVHLEGRRMKMHDAGAHLKVHSPHSHDHTRDTHCRDSLTSHVWNGTASLFYLTNVVCNFASPLCRGYHQAAE
jgi:hypothetical protein